MSLEKKIVTKEPSSAHFETLESAIFDKAQLYEKKTVTIYMI